MPLLLWYDNYKVGIDEIDADHQNLFSIANKISDDMDQSINHDAFIKGLDALVAYCHEHFDREERILADWGYPELDDHKEKHVALGNQVAEFKEAYELAPEQFNYHEILVFLKRWLKGHILVEDKAYADFIKQQKEECA